MMMMGTGPEHEMNEPVPSPPPVPSKIPETTDEGSQRSFRSMMNGRLSDQSSKTKRKESMKKIKKSTSFPCTDASADPFVPKKISKSKSMNENLDKKKSSSSLSPSSTGPRKVSNRKISLRGSGSNRARRTIPVDDLSPRSLRSTTSSKKSKLSSIISRPLSEGNLKNKKKEKRNKVEENKDSNDPFLPKRIGKSKSMNVKLDKLSASSRKRISSETSSASFSAEFSPGITSRKGNNRSFKKVSLIRATTSNGNNNTDDSSQRSSRSTTSSKLSASFSAALSSPSNKISRKGSTDESSQRSNRSITSSKKSKLSSIMSSPLSEKSFLSSDRRTSSKKNNKRKDKSNKMKQSKSDQFLPTRIGKSKSMNEKWDSSKPSSRKSSSSRNKKISSDKSASFHGEYSPRISPQNSANNLDEDDSLSQRSMSRSTNITNNTKESEKYRASQQRMENNMSSKEKAARTKAIMDTLVDSLRSTATADTLLSASTRTDMTKSIPDLSSTTHNKKVQFNDNVRLLKKIDYSKFDRDQLWFSDAEITVHRTREQKLNRESANINSPQQHLDVEGMFTLKERNVRTSRILQSYEAVFDMQLVNKKEKELHDAVGLFPGEALEGDHELALAEEYMLVSTPATESAVWRATHLEMHVQLLWQDEPAETITQGKRSSKIINNKKGKAPKRKKSTKVPPAVVPVVLGGGDESTTNVSRRCLVRAV